jgi:hypothetical protein
MSVVAWGYLAYESSENVLKSSPLARQAAPVDPHRGDINVLLSAGLVLFVTIWLVALISGKLASTEEALRPHLPSWFSLVNALIIPVTYAFAASRLISFRLSLFFGVAMLVQLSLFGLTSHDHPAVKIAVTVILYYESFVLVPRWNRRILERRSGGHGSA